MAKNIILGPNEVANIVVGEYTIQCVCFDNKTIWEDGEPIKGKVYIEFYNQWIDKEYNYDKDFAVYLKGDFDNWGKGILMQGAHGFRRAVLPIGPGESMNCKFYVFGWGDDGWQTGDYPDEGYMGQIQIAWDADGKHIRVLNGGNTFEVLENEDTIITNGSY